jgi:hypothetical protein
LNGAPASIHPLKSLRLGSMNPRSQNRDPGAPGSRGTQMISVSITGLGKSSAYIDHNPDECPLCHRSRSISALYFVQVSDNLLQGLYQCAKLECHRLFIASFIENKYEACFQLKGVGPLVPVEKPVDPKLIEISPEFVGTYQQAWRAKQLNMGKIAGTGFRRALEFLVKDYAVRDQPDDKKELILEKPMAQCIRDHIHEDGIKTVSERAVWLGNDETHYLRKWDDKDITDLIDLIDSVSNWIVIHLKTEHLKSTMLPRKAPTPPKVP